MKKMVRFAAMLMLLATLLCGCGKFTCDRCGEEKSGKKYKGVKYTYCQECYDLIVFAAELFD